MKWSTPICGSAVQFEFILVQNDEEEENYKHILYKHF